MTKTIIWYYKNGLKNVIIDQLLDHTEATQIIETNYNGIYISSHLLENKEDYCPTKEI